MGILVAGATLLDSSIFAEVTGVGYEPEGQILDASRRWITGWRRQMGRASAFM